MPNYPQLKTDAVDKDNADAVKLKTQIDALMKKGKKGDAAKLIKQYDALAKKIVAECNRNIKTAYEGSKKAEKEVDARLGVAMKRLSEAKAALARFQKSKDSAVLRPVNGISSDLRKLAEAASDAMSEFASSWDSWRQFKPKVDMTLLKEFGKTRMTLMERTAQMRTKVNKIVALAAEADSVEEAAIDADQGFETDTENRAQQAQQLLDQVRKAIVTVNKKNNPEMITRAVESWQDWFKMAYDDFSKQYESRQSSYELFKASASASNQAVNSLKRSIAATKKMFSAEDLRDRRIADIFRQLDAVFGEFETRTKNGVASLQEVAKILTKADARMKAKA